MISIYSKEIPMCITANCGARSKIFDYGDREGRIDHLYCDSCGTTISDAAVALKNTPELLGRRNSNKTSLRQKQLRKIVQENKLLSR